MQFNRFSKFIYKVFQVSSPLVALAVFQAPAQAWNYTWDGVEDDLGVYKNGERQSFDILGMGMKYDDDYVYVGINSRLSHLGLDRESIDDRIVQNGNIGFGDFFFDFSGSGNFEQSHQNLDLIGVKFIEGNDSDRFVGSGVYRQVNGKSVQHENAGVANHKIYQQKLDSYGRGQNASVGDLSATDSYWDIYQGGGSANIIQGGSRTGDSAFLDENALLSLGFNKNQFQSSSTNLSFSNTYSLERNESKLYGFRVERSLLPSGSFIATFMQECLNDSIAMIWNFEEPEEKDKGTPQSVPEPSSMLALSAVGLFAARKLSQRKHR